MPIIKSAIKRVRQSAKRRSHNLQIKRAIHKDVRVFNDATEAGDMKAIAVALREAISEIDRAVKKGTLHRNTASRRKSKLQKQANGVGAKVLPRGKAVATKTAKPKAKAVAKKSAVKAKPNSKK